MTVLGQQVYDDGKRIGRHPGQRLTLHTQHHQAVLLPLGLDPFLGLALLLPCQQDIDLAVQLFQTRVDYGCTNVAVYAEDARGTGNHSSENLLVASKPVSQLGSTLLPLLSVAKSNHVRVQEFGGVDSLPAERYFEILTELKRLGVAVVSLAFTSNNEGRRFGHHRPRWWIAYRPSAPAIVLHSTGASRQQWTTRAWLRLPTGALRLSAANGLAHVSVEPERHAVLYALQRVYIDVVPSVHLSFCVQ